MSVGPESARVFMELKYGLELRRAELLERLENLQVTKESSLEDKEIFEVAKRHLEDLEEAWSWLHETYC